MRARSRATLVLLATLVLGIVVGVALGGALRHLRERRGPGMRPRPAFVEQMQRIIDPQDESQRRAIRPILEATAEDNERILRGAREDLRAALEEMIRELEPHLDEEQLRRLEEFAGRPPGRGPPRPRRGR